MIKTFRSFETLENILTALKYSVQELLWPFKSKTSLLRNRIDLQEEAACVVEQKRTEFIFPLNMFFSDNANHEHLFFVILEYLIKTIYNDSL